MRYKITTERGIDGQKFGYQEGIWEFSACTGEWRFVSGDNLEIPISERARIADEISWGEREGDIVGSQAWFYSTNMGEPEECDDEAVVLRWKLRVLNAKCLGIRFTFAKSQGLNIALTEKYRQYIDEAIALTFGDRNPTDAEVRLLRECGWNMDELIPRFSIRGKR
jgi:hypothetical protein